MGELLSWAGNSVNFLILIYFYIKFVQTPGQLSDLWIATFGICVGILIQLYNVFQRK